MMTTFYFWVNYLFNSTCVIYCNTRLTCVDDFVPVQVADAVKYPSAHVTRMNISVKIVVELNSATKRNLTRLPSVLLLHCRIRQVVSVDDQVSVVRGLQSKAAVTQGAVVTFFLMQVHYVFQVVTTLGECHLRKWGKGRINDFARNIKCYLFLFSHSKFFESVEFH